MTAAGIPATVRYGGAEPDHVMIVVTVKHYDVERARQAARKNFGLEAAAVIVRTA
jgi:hypothetical protein